MANSNLKTLSEIFNEKLFRIPDYQRGYSWEQQQLEDLWRDIDNLPLGKSHYTGMITVDIQDNKTYHVIDGQQRLTTLVIFLKNLLEKFNDEWIDDIEKIDAIKKYLYARTKNKKNPKIIFGYYENNPSFYYYKTKILGIEDKINEKVETTLYTENLSFANEFFYTKLKDKEETELEVLFKKITNQLKFNWYEIEKTDDLDEYVIFETMNNRGKPLSVLEILKNRLIYITTLLDDTDENDKRKLRDDINDVWKTIFEYLGKDRKLDEDWFLKYHTVMYWGKTFDKREDLHKTYLLNDFFAIQKLFNEDKENYKKSYNKLNNLTEHLNKLKNIKKTQSNIEKIRSILIEIFNQLTQLQEYLKKNINLSLFENKDDYINCFLNTKERNIINDKWEFDYYIEYVEKIIVNSLDIIERKYLYYSLIENYISSLKESIKSYYFIMNPQRSNYNKDIKQWLEKINIIGFSEFMPILFSIFNHYNDKDKNFIVKIIQEIENYLFVKKYCFTKGQQWLSRDFYCLASEYNKNQNIESLYYKLNNLIYAKKGIIGNFRKENFILNINELFKEKKEKSGDGFYAWNGLKYLLYEYEIFLQKKNNGKSKITWDEIKNDSIEHIYPQTPKGTWIDDFKNLRGEERRKKYASKIGNLLLLSQKRNSQASNKPFNEKKEMYSNGTFSEIEVSKYDKWTTKEIDERSRNILEFMNDRWHLGLKIADIDKLIKI